jgi:mannose-6-phosphate isomerase-like protein (cupin superfamily)
MTSPTLTRSRAKVPAGSSGRSAELSAAARSASTISSSPPNTVGREHDHAEANQEEVYLIVKGSGVMRVDGEEVELKPGRVVRVDPASRRAPTSGPDGLEWFVVGAPIGHAYEPPSWG